MNFVTMFLMFAIILVSPHLEAEFAVMLAVILILFSLPCILLETLWKKRVNKFRDCVPTKPKRKEGYDYCEKCDKELGKTLPAGSGYRGGCDCELGSPPGWAEQKDLIGKMGKSCRSSFIDEEKFLDNMAMFNQYIPEDQLILIAKDSVILSARGIDAGLILRNEIKKAEGVNG